MDYSLYYLQEFKKYISLHTASPNTIKNYLSDLRLFLFFVTQNQHLILDPQNLPAYITDDFIIRYNEFLSVTNPPATAKRRISSLKKFIDYCGTQGIYSTPAVTAVSAPAVTPALSTPFVQPAYTQPPPPVVPDYSDQTPFAIPAAQNITPPPIAYPPSPAPAVFSPSPITPPPETFYQPVVHNTPEPTPVTGNTLPDPGNLVHNLLDLKPANQPPAIPVTTSPAPARSFNIVLPVIISVSSLLISFSLTLLIHMLFFR